MGQIIHVVNFHKLEKNCTSIKNQAVSLTTAIQSTDLDSPFPKTYFKNTGLTVRGFTFFYPNLSRDVSVKK